MAGFELLLTPATGKSGSRMHVLSISDLKHREALAAMRRIRMNAGKTVNNSIIEQVVSIVGGRLSYINKVGTYTQRGLAPPSSAGQPHSSFTTCMTRYRARASNSDHGSAGC